MDATTDPSRPTRTRFGTTLSSEELGPRQLVEVAAAAESAGFDFAAISDHFHPWTSEQGHSPFVWSVLGAVAEATDHIEIAIGVTCPILRIHPAIVAHAAATTALLLPGRFRLGLGTGENLNEHVLGQRWPPPETRMAMLVEAIDVMRELWTGRTVDHRGEFYTVENARLFDVPEDPVPIVVGAFGPTSTEVPAPLADGYWNTGPDRDLVQTYVDHGGSGPRYGQMTVCWSRDRDEARRSVQQWWPNTGLPGQLAQELPTWSHIEQATSVLSLDQITEGVVIGDDVDEWVAAVDEYVDAGFDHVYFHQVGPDQSGFLSFWEKELGPRLTGS